VHRLAHLSKGTRPAWVAATGRTIAEWNLISSGVFWDVSADVGAIRTAVAPGLGLGRVLINISGLDVRFRGITGHGKATLNRSKMTHLRHRRVRMFATQSGHYAPFR
jgi:hypothetical protein